MRLHGKQRHSIPPPAFLPRLSGTVTLSHPLVDPELFRPISTCHEVFPPALAFLHFYLAFTPRSSAAVPACFARCVLGTQSAQSRPLKGRLLSTTPPSLRISFLPTLCLGRRGRLWAPQTISGGLFCNPQRSFITRLQALTLMISRLPFWILAPAFGKTPRKIPHF